MARFTRRLARSSTASVTSEVMITRCASRGTWSNSVSSASHPPSDSISAAPSITTASRPSSLTAEVRTASITSPGVATSTSAASERVPHPPPDAAMVSPADCAKGTISIAARSAASGVAERTRTRVPPASAALLVALVVVGAGAGLDAVQHAQAVGQRLPRSAAGAGHQVAFAAQHRDGGGLQGRGPLDPRVFERGQQRLAKAEVLK